MSDGNRLLTAVVASAKAIAEAHHEWRAAHERFWSEEVIPRLPPGWAGPLADDTEVVVERFRLVE